jgi:serine protease Do
VTAAAAAVALLGALTEAAAAEPPRPRVAPVPAALTELADRARPAVVHVRGTLEEKGRDGRASPAMSVGSGFLFDRSGSIVTNEHVVRGTTELRVRLYDGRELAACVVGTDAVADIALLQIDPGRMTLAVLPLGNSDRVRAGEVVLAIGSPFGFAHSVTAGIVSANERVVEQDTSSALADERDEPPYAFFIQTDASINVGNSGGPLVDTTGAVIGVNAAFWGGPQPAQGVGFAIPINVVKLLLPQLRAQGAAPRSYLGVDSQPLTSELAVAFRLPGSRGAIIAGVEKGSAAEQAGIEVGDVITTWGGHALYTGADFRIFSQLTPPGTKVKVTLLREGKAMERLVTTRPGPRVSRPRHAADCRSASAEAAGPSLGFEVRDLPRARAGEVPGGRGVQIARVYGGVAREAKLGVGDVILRVGQTPVSSADELRKRLEEWKRDLPLPLLVRTRSRAYWTALRPR